MDIKFDETQPSVLKGLGVTEVRFDKIKADFVKEGEKVSPILKKIFDSDLAIEEKIALAYDIASVMGQKFAINEIQKQAKAEEASMLAQIQQTQPIQ